MGGTGEGGWAGSGGGIRIGTSGQPRFVAPKPRGMSIGSRAYGFYGLGV